VPCAEEVLGEWSVEVLFDGVDMVFETEGWNGEGSMLPRRLRVIQVYEIFRLSSLTQDGHGWITGIRVRVAPAPTPAELENDLSAGGTQAGGGVGSTPSTHFVNDGNAS
jgi:hypothetical protein